jgi:hypothetical protein
LRGQSPYTVAGFYSPPWALVPFVLLAWLPDRWAVWVFALVLVAACLYLSRRLGVPWWASAAFLLSAPVMVGVWRCNIDVLVLLAVLLPPRWGLLVALCKPQVGGGLALYWLWRAFRQRRLLATVAPTAIVLALSFVAFGFWPAHTLRDGQQLVEAEWNHALWPWGAAVGLALLAWAFWKRRPAGALGASPFLSPYASGNCWCGLTLAMAVETPGLLALATAGSLAYLAVVIASFVAG